jgi:IgGFc binding protein
MHSHARLTLLVAVTGLAACQDCGNVDRSGLADAGGLGAADSGGGSTGDGGLASLCFGSTYRCDGERAVSCDDGTETRDCGAEGKLCDERLGCVECMPGERSCSDGRATYCRDDGTLATYDCDSAQGLDCTAQGCEGACDLAEIDDSYIGCDYYPTTTLNPVWHGFPFAVAVSNTSGVTTHVTITRGADVVSESDVPAGSLQTITLPWVDEVKGGEVTCEIPPPVGPTRLAKGGAYRLRTDQPVTVYQFSPLEYMLDPVPAGCPVLSQCAPPEAMNTETRCLSYSNDASLLLPATALTGNYIAMAFASQENGAGFVAVTATEDGTEVEVYGHGKFVAGAGVAADGTGKVSLDRGDVLELVAADGSDPSGTRIRATKPVQVIGGHSCAYVPSSDVPNCDHIEEALFPEDTLGDDYVVTYPVFADLSSATPLYVRISAIEDDTRVAFDPQLQGSAALDAGEILDLYLDRTTAQNVRISGTKPIVVASYMTGQASLSASAIVGDPSLSLAVPVRQWRSDYLFTAPTTYIVNIADVVAKDGATVRIDGRLIEASAFSPVGDSGFSVAHVELSHDKAVHTLSADNETGLTVYGYGLFTSYMYPGGADLERITIPPVL